MEIMKPEEQRIAIAKACGFTIESDGITHCLTPCDFSGNYNPEAKLLKKVPDYLNDLNAMHEAEQSLDIVQQGQMVRHLSHLGTRWGLIATAAQRAEAFLKTLNLWNE